MKNIGRKKINVIVTGAANGVGQSILKSLNLSELKLNIIPADISDRNAINSRFVNFVVIPKVEEKYSLSKIVKIIKNYKINILFVGSEFEIEFFSKNKKEIENKTGCLIAVSPLKTIKLFNDKFKTFLFLEKNNIIHPKTFRCFNEKDLKKISKKLKFPVYIKPSIGTSSKNTFFCKNLNQLKSYFKIINKPVIQEFIGSGKKSINNNEYTCSYFFDREGNKLGPFIAKRNLKFGTSWEIEIIKSKKIKKLMESICKNLSVRGSINIQFKEKGTKIYPLEINPRFSGTTSIRANFGFNEPEMFILNYFLNKKIKKIKVKHGKVYRYIEEVFIEKNYNNKKGYINSWI